MHTKRHWKPRYAPLSRIPVSGLTSRYPPAGGTGFGSRPISIVFLLHLISGIVSGSNRTGPTFPDNERYGQVSGNRSYAAVRSFGLSLDFPIKNIFLVS